MNEFVSSYTALPNLHPIVVHLPLAVFPMALLFDIVSTMSPRLLGLRGGARALYVLGALGAGGAFWAGKVAAGGFGLLSPSTQAAIGEHSDAALVTLWIVALGTGIRLLASWLNRRKEVKRAGALKVTAMVVALVGSLALFRTADLGGALVYRHALGVTSETPAIVETVAVSGDKGGPGPTEPGSRLRQESEVTRLEDGSILWQPSSSSGTRLFDDLTVEPGDTVQVITSESDPGSGLGLKVSGRSLLLLPGVFGDVQVEAAIDLVDFDGTLGLVHHFRDATSLGVFTLTTQGVARLESVQEGKIENLDEKELELPESIAIAVSASGSHLKGILNDETVVHGHQPPAENGRCGLLLDGEGTLRIHSLILRPAVEH